MAGFSSEADGSERHSVGLNSALMASGTLVSRVLGLVRTSMTGAAIGMGVVGDAFNGANQLPNYIYLLISGGLLEPVIVPQIAKAARRPDSKEYIDKLITVALVLLAVVTVAVTAATPLLFKLLRLSAEAQQLGVAFAFICLPQVFFYGLYTVLSQVLNARGSYAAPMWSPAINNIVTIAGLAAFMAIFGVADTPVGWSAAMIWLFAGTATLGIIAQGVILIPPLIKDGFTWRPRWGFPRQEFAHLSKYTFWTFMALLVSTIGGLAILAITSNMPTKAGELGIGGFVAGNNVMNYAFLIFMLPQSIIAISVITALFPPMTRAWQSNNRKGMRRLVKQGLELPAVFLIPATVGIIVLAGPLVKVIFPGNSAAELNALAPVLVAMCVGLVPMAIQTLQQRYCFASEQGKLNFSFQIVITAIQLVIAGGALVLLDPRYGVFAVAVGQSLAYAVAALGFALVARRQLGRLNLNTTLRLYIRLGIASVISGVAAYFAAHLTLLVGGTAWLWQVCALAAGLIAFLVIFVVFAKLMRIREFFDLLRPVAAKLLRR